MTYRPNRRTRKGFTLVEITLAMAVAAVVGLGVVSLTSAMFSAIDASNDSYGCVQTGRVLMLRLASVFRSAQLITDVSPDNASVMAWAGDTNGDRAINFSELMIIRWDSQTQQVVRETIE